MADLLASPTHINIVSCPTETKQLFVTALNENKCLTHDGYIQIGIFNHSVEKHIEINPCIDWLVVHWYPDVFKNRYKRVAFQKTAKANEGSPKTDNAGMGTVDLKEDRPRDFPYGSEPATIQEENRLQRSV